MNNIDYFIKFRKEVHKNPELAFEEKETKEFILSHFAGYSGFELIEFDDFSFAIVVDSGKEGKNVLFRTELDALPIHEINEFEYKSKSKNVSHKCGHDGHLTIITALATKFLEKPKAKGKAIFLYQSAEEIGAGAERVFKHKNFNQLDIDYCFALHNIPGEELGKILVKDGVFTAASTGYIIKLFGKTSHAAEPENGLNPALAISEIVQTTQSLINTDVNSEDFTLITPIQIDMGSEAFGTSAGYGELKFTIRAYQNEIMQNLINNLENEIQIISSKYYLKYEIEFKDYFHANENDKQSVEIIKDVANKLNINLKEIENPYKWSEDFGAISSNFKGAMFGLGSGVDCPALHNPDYDFPDELIEIGKNIFNEIYNELNK